MITEQSPVTFKQNVSSRYWLLVPVFEVVWTTFTFWFFGCIQFYNQFTHLLCRNSSVRKADPSSLRGPTETSLLCESERRVRLGKRSRKFCKLFKFFSSEIVDLHRFKKCCFFYFGRHIPRFEGYFLCESHRELPTGKIWANKLFSTELQIWLEYRSRKKLLHIRIGSSLF